MAYKIEESKTATASKYVNALSRYQDSKVYVYGDEKKLTFEVYKRRTYPVTTYDKYAVIPEGFAYRPDLVSVQVYGYPDSWWLIMEINGIYDIKDFVAGKTSRLPINTF
jgi:hypothetical protein